VKGEVVLTPFTVPGDVVEVAIEPSGNPRRARVLNVIEPSKDRVTPACEHVSICGGCDWMQVGLDAQATAHTSIVRDLVGHAIRASGEPLPEITAHAPLNALAYRTRARVFVTVDRSGRPRVGYRASASRDVVDVSSCAVLSPALEAARASLAAMFTGARGDGDVQLALGVDGAPVLDAVWRGELPQAVWSRLGEATTRDTDGKSAFAGARIRLDGATAPATFGDPRPVVMGADGAPLVIAAGGFAQPSDEGGALLARRVLELAGKEPRHTLELFAGSGTLSVLLARWATSFASIELDRDSVAAARENFKARGIEGRLSVGDADAPSAFGKAQLVVLDPPRTGAAGAVKAIVAAGPRWVIYVSCDPASLARDLGALSRGSYRLTHLETVELFPQTSHVETIARLERRRG
jgi:23S rRNA (uracil1939-C5)-methyltransferase